MAGKLGKFQMVGFSHWKGLTKENHLGSIFQLAPQKATNLMVQLLAYHRGKTLDTFLSQFPTREFEDDNEYYWEVVGSSRRNIPLVEARDENGTVVGSSVADTTMIGAGTAPFYLVFPEDWFADGEYIVGNLNEVYQFRILGDARMEGSNAVYKVELAGGNTNGVPAERLRAGERFSVEAAFVEKEGSRKVGDVRFSSPVSMRNEWSQVRIQHKVMGSMLGKKLACGIPIVDKAGKKSVATMWMHNVDWEVEQQFSEYKNNALAFGRSNRNSNGEYMNFGKSGNVIKTGAGLFEQMEVANTMYYNTFSLKLLEDALYELSAAKLEMGDRYFLIKTGERGAIQFHKAVLQTVSGWTQFVGDGAAALGMIEKTQSNLHTNALAAGFQFVEYKAPNGVRVKIDVDPFYDDPVRNKIQHPNGGPAFSYRYDIMYIGTMDQPNIFKCKIKGDNEYRGYQWGLRNPFTGQKGNPNMSFDEDAAIIHRMATLGICVLDPTRTMSLIPAVLQA